MKKITSNTDGLCIALFSSIPALGLIPPEQWHQHLLCLQVCLFLQAMGLTMWLSSFRLISFDQKRRNDN